MVTESLSTDTAAFRVLVECPAQPWNCIAKEAKQLPGVDARFCGGPSSRPGGCPLLHGASCPLAKVADVVIAALGMDSTGQELLSRLREVRPAESIVVPAWHRDIRDHPALLADTHVVPFPWTTKRLGAAVAAAGRGAHQIDASGGQECAWQDS